MGNENSQDERNEEHKYCHILCICGSKLFETKIKSYRMIYCDRCYNKRIYNQLVYECVAMNNKVHPDGYHICEECIAIPNKSELTTTPYTMLKNMRLDYDDDLLLLALGDTNGDIPEAVKWLQKNAIPRKIAKSKPNSNNTRYKPNIQNQIEHNEHTQLTQHKVEHTEHIGTVSSLSCCDINCPSLKRTCDILKYCQQWIQNKSNHDKNINRSSGDDSITCQLHNIYHNVERNHTELLNDFHHLLFQHEFEAIYNYLISDKGLENICQRAACTMFERNHRDRFKCSLNDTSKNFYYGAQSIQEINIQQIIDKIHCYFLHSFDTGNRLTTQERTVIRDIENDEKGGIDNTLSELVRIVRSKKNMTLSKKNKFNTTHTMFSFGTQFIYPQWKGYKELLNESIEFEEKTSTYIDETSNVKMLPIHYKHKSFKDEMLFNKVSIFQWKSQLGLADNHLSSDFCKEQQPDESAIETSRKEIGYENIVFIIKHSITAEHLMVVLLYCGFDDLSTKFSATYRKKNDETDESLIQRHQNFANLGRFLHEACYYFSDNRHGNYFYHGISEKVYFDHTVSAFYAPFSTSQDRSVAVNFAAFLGMILTLKTELFMDLKGGFSCDWISDFASEQEVLFFGYGTLRIVNIVDVLSNQSYEFYMIAMNFIESLMKGLWYDPPDNRKFILSSSVSNAPKVAWRMLHHELNRYKPYKFHKWKEIPKYVQSLFNFYCTQQTVVYIRWEALNKNNKCDVGKSLNATQQLMLYYQNSGADNSNIKGYKFLRKVLCLDNLTFIDLALFITLFPNVNWIKITTADGIEPEYKFNPAMIEAVFSFIQQTKRICKLNQIQFICSHDQEEHGSLFDKMIKKYRMSFKQCGWSMNKEFREEANGKKGETLMIKRDGTSYLVNL